jgi:glycosyltransferase involved in cell wall biosynthesis
MSAQKTLFFFTISFPFGEGETFIQNEFPYLAKAFDKIVIISSARRGESKELPAHVTVYSLEELLKGKSKKKIFLKNIRSIANIMTEEFLHCASARFFIKHAREYNSLLINSFICSEAISEIPGFNKNGAFYSFWLNNHALTLSVMKKQNKINHFLFRVHGYDLILERWPHRYIAFQHTCHKYADRILTVSNKSLDYFKNTFSHSEKASSSHLGSLDNGLNPPTQNESAITLVSCSNIIPLKRLHLIIEVLKNVNQKVRWIHFGDGYLRNEIEAKAMVLKNHEVEFRGRVSQDELFSYYKNYHVDFFINVSDSEGLPFTIIEASSFGIPIIATNVGGTSEIVNESTGVLVDENFNPLQVSEVLNNYRNSNYKSAEFREGVRSFWKRYFSAEATYPDFIKTYLLEKHETI